MGYRESSFDKFTILLPVLSCLLSPKKVALHDVSPIYQGNSSLFKCLSFRGLNSLRKLKRHCRKNVFSDIWRHFAEVLVQVSSSEHRYDTVLCQRDPGRGFVQRLLSARLFRQLQSVLIAFPSKETQIGIESPPLPPGLLMLVYSCQSVWDLIALYYL